jgi:hypothetical protein
MLKISDYAKALTIATLVSTTLAIAPVRADDGGLEDPPLIQASFSPVDSEAAYATYNCEEQRANKEFIRELSRSDGGEMPDLASPVNCRSEAYAVTNVDAD